MPDEAEERLVDARDPPLSEACDECLAEFCWLRSPEDADCPPAEVRDERPSEDCALPLRTFARVASSAEDRDA